MENTGRTLRNAEELRDKAEYAVKEHIRGIKLPAALIALNAPSEDDKQHDVEDYLKLPRRPARGFGAEDKAALAAARYDAVDTGAHQGKHHADEKDIKDLARLALEQLCAEGLFELAYLRGIRKTPPKMLIFPRESGLKPDSAKANSMTVSTPYTV